MEFHRKKPRTPLVNNGKWTLIQCSADMCYSTFNPSRKADSYVIWGGLLIAMVLANTWGCRHYLRSLDAASNSVAPTVISAASSYVLSGIIGITLFEEASSVLWWVGATLIIAGLSLVARPRTKNKRE